MSGFYLFKLHVLPIFENKRKMKVEYKIFAYSEAFRCGLFFPPEVEGELPIAPLYIFNASFPATECPTENTERFNSFCHSIVRKTIRK